MVNAINEYVSIANDVKSQTDSRKRFNTDEAILKSAYKKVTDAFAAGGLSLQSLPGLTYKTVDADINDLFNDGIKVTSDTTIYYNDNPILIKQNYGLTITLMTTKYLLIGWYIDD